MYVFIKTNVLAYNYHANGIFLLIFSSITYYIQPKTKNLKIELWKNKSKYFNFQKISPIPPTVPPPDPPSCLSR